MFWKQILGSLASSETARGSTLGGIGAAAFILSEILPDPWRSIAQAVAAIFGSTGAGMTVHGVRVAPIRAQNGGGSTPQPTQ